MCLSQEVCNTQEHVQAKLCLPSWSPSACACSLKDNLSFVHMQQPTSLFGQPFGQILGSIQSLQPVTLVLLNGCKGAEDLFLCCFLNNECIEILGEAVAIYHVSPNTSLSSYELLVLSYQASQWNGKNSR